MNRLSALLSLLLLLLAPSVPAQEDPIDAAAEKVTVPDDDCAETRPDGVIAAIGQELIPAIQIEAMVAPALAAIEKERREARFAVISRAVQNFLLEREAKRRGLDLESFLEIEVHSKVEAPTETEITQHGRRSPDRFGTDLAAAREWIVAELETEKVAKLGEALLNSLTEGVSIEWPFNFRQPDSVPALDAPIAVVDGTPILGAAILELWEDQEYEFDLRAYFERRARLDLIINSRLLERAASEARVDTRTLLAERVESQLVPITDEEIETFFAANRQRIVEPLESVRAAIGEHLTDLRRRDLETAYASDLREKAAVVIYLDEPAPPVHVIEVEGRPVLGPDAAPVTLIQFTDFQCARCRELHGVIAGLPEFYEGKVRVILRNKPLVTLHPFAHRAAVAAEAARRQGKYFEYVALLFERQSEFANGKFEEWAMELGLDRAKFLADRESPDCRAIVEEDLLEAARLGIHRTPVLYLNGRRLDDNSIEGLFRGLRQEFLRLGIDVVGE